jgi:hypothetical protein
MKKAIVLGGGGFIGGHDYVPGQYGVYQAVDERFDKDFELHGVSWLHRKA